MPILGAALAAGASLIGGLFGRDDAKKQAKKEERAIRNSNAQMQEMADRMNREQRARADAAALVPVQRASYSSTISRGDVNTTELLADAERLGVNPISYIRSGAAGLYSVSQTDNESFDCTTGERAMDAAGAGNYIPQLQPVISQTQVPSMGTVLGNAAMTGVNQYLADKTIEENNAFQMKMLERQLAGANSGGSYQGSRSLYVPTATVSGPGATKAKYPDLMQGYVDNRPDSPTKGQVLYFPNEQLSPEAVLALPMLKTGQPGGSPGGMPEFNTDAWTWRPPPRTAPFIAPPAPSSDSLGPPSDYSTWFWQ